MKSIYLIGSLRNPRVPEVGCILRASGYDVFDDWYAAGPEADDKWQEYETLRGRTHQQALAGYAANHVYHYDRYHLDRCGMGILLMPAGKSGHLELGYLAGQGKPVFILFEEPVARWDVMHLFATPCFDLPELIGRLKSADLPSVKLGVTSEDAEGQGATREYWSHNLQRMVRGIECPGTVEANGQRTSCLLVSGHRGNCNGGLVDYRHSGGERQWGP